MRRFQTLVVRCGQKVSTVTLRNSVYFGPWLSLVERLVRVEEVAGSNPAGPTTLESNFLHSV